MDHRKMPQIVDFANKTKKIRRDKKILYVAPLLFAAGLGVASVAGLKNKSSIDEFVNSAKQYLTNFSDRREGYSVSVNEDGLYVAFRGKKFELHEVKVGQWDTVDSILYYLNNKENIKCPKRNLKIKGDSLARLEDLFALIKNNPELNLLLKSGGSISYKNKPASLSIITGRTYLFPTYTFSGDCNEKEKQKPLN